MDRKSVKREAVVGSLTDALLVIRVFATVGKGH